MAHQRHPKSDRVRPEGSPLERAETPGPSFGELGLPSSLTRALIAQGINAPFPIQTATLPDALAGRNLLGKGKTGSGKTLAFVLPLLARLSQEGSATVPRKPRALILAPTRELARQIQLVIEPLAEAVNLTSVTVFGGVNQRPQVNALRRGRDIVVACPGRLEDLMSAGALRLDDVEICILDEADHMSDMGFLPSVTRILNKVPAAAQKMLFSATLDSAVDVVVKRFITDPLVHSVEPDHRGSAQMTYRVLHVPATERLGVLIDLASEGGKKVVFTRTKHRAKTLTRQMRSAGVDAVEMHGNLSQGARVKNLEAFMSGRSPVMVATDIAARGLHIDDVELVIHADPPLEHKTYLHRSGRTARAGAAGTVITVATPEQRDEVAKLNKKAGIRPEVAEARSERVQAAKPTAHHSSGEAQGKPKAKPGSAKPGSKPAGNARSKAAGRRSEPARETAGAAPGSSGFRRRARRSGPGRRPG